MKDFVKITEFNITLDRNNVLYLMDCKQDNPIYDDIKNAYEDIEAEALKLLEPAAYYKFNSLSNDITDQLDMDLEKLCTNKVHAIYVILTIGNGITELASRYFEQGDYLIGMLVHAIADSYLFQMDNVLKDSIRKNCLLRHMGIIKRLEAPIDIPMSTQEKILNEIKMEVKLPIDVTKGFMYTIIKTMGYILLLTDDMNEYNAGHDCSKCSTKNCKMRKPAIKT